MEQSILKSTKKILQIGPDDESFDLDVMTHINSAFSTLNDLGVGPEEGFVIEDDTVVWEDFLEDNVVQLNRIKTFVYLHSRLLFDPPLTTFHLNAMQDQLQETTWRLSVKREASDWVDPNLPILPDDDVVTIPPSTPPPDVIEGGDAG